MARIRQKYNQDKQYVYSIYLKNADTMEVIADFSLQNDAVTAVTNFQLYASLQDNWKGYTFNSGERGSKIIFTIDNFKDAVETTYRKAYTKKILQYDRT